MATPRRGAGTRNAAWCVVCLLAVWSGAGAYDDFSSGIYYAKGEMRKRRTTRATRRTAASAAAAAPEASAAHIAFAM